MPSIGFSLVLVFLSSCFIQSTTCALPNYLQNLELDDITSLVDKFPLIISKIKEAVNRFRCPKGWKRLGGSCFYLSDVTSTSLSANDTCNLLHSNQSNLMQIRHTVELFYAAHVLTKNNLSSLMINIDPNLLKGKRLANFLMEDQGRWQRMKEKFREIRVRYHKLKAKILQELESAGLRISRRSKKIKQNIRKYKEKFRPSSSNPHTYYDYDDIEEQIIMNYTESDNVSEATTVEEYEYDDLNSNDESDEFEQFDSISGICDQIAWNVYDYDSTVYVLTTYEVSDQIVCSLSNVEPDVEYDHVCEYVLDFCFANIICGKHGHCVNTLSGFKCSCSFLYGGLLCERVSQQGKQIIISFIAIFILYMLSFKPVRWLLMYIVSLIKRLCTRCIKSDKIHNIRHRKKAENEDYVANEGLKDNDSVENEERASFVEEVKAFFSSDTFDPLKDPTKRDLIRSIWVSGLVIFFLSVLYISTTLIHMSSFKYEINEDTKLDTLANETARLVARCEHISNSRRGNWIFFPVAVGLIAIFSWSVKREQRCAKMCDGRPGLIPPIEPFRTTNRFTTATVFGILAFEVLKTFEEFLFSKANPVSFGVLFELLELILMVVLIGIRYYPVLASLQLSHFISRFLICLYILGDISFTIIREGFCMGFIPLSKYYSPLEEAKLRIELGTWFIVYGLIKTTPHFLFLSYIAAELCVRFAYDSMYKPLKNRFAVCSAPVAPLDELEFARFYVKKLFRRNAKDRERRRQRLIHINNLEPIMNNATENSKPIKRNSHVTEFIKWIYPWDNDFRFTTMAMSTYTVAIVFLYYLSCTFVFLYISRTVGHISFVRYYIESTFNIEFKGLFSLRFDIILSAVITFFIYALELFFGLKNYKKHKLALYKGIFEDLPSAANFKPNSIISKSVHYSGFLVGYVAWGFLISFHLVLAITIVIRLILYQIRYIEAVLAIVVPVSMVYILKMLSVSSVGQLMFLQDDDDDKVSLNNRKLYAVFVYFNFFADCFMGVASCFTRFVKATLLNLIYMARLDCSFLGRPIERFDLGYASYVSYIHMEASQTNPIMIAFCYALFDETVKKRKKKCYDDECCIGPGELDEEEIIVEQSSKTNKTSLEDTTNKKDDGLSTKTPDLNGRGIKISIPVNKEKRNTVTPIDDTHDHRSSGEQKPKTKSPSPSIISAEENHKSKTNQVDYKDKSPRENGIYSEEAIVSTIGRLVPEKLPQLSPLPSTPAPKPPKRTDIPTEEDEFDEDGGPKPSTITTISTIIPREKPRLFPIQGTVPPPTPKRSDLVDEEYDEDGGIDPRVTARRKQEQAEKKRQKEEAKKKKKVILVDDGYDEDGGPLPSATKPKEKPKKTHLILDEDEDEDGGVSRKKLLEAEQKKKAKEAKKQREALIRQDSDYDEDGGPNRKEPIQKKQDKQPSKPKAPDDNDDDDEYDEDGGPIVKTYSTIKKMMPNAKPVLRHQTEAQPSSRRVEDVDKFGSSDEQKPLLKSFNTINQLLPKVSIDPRRTPEENHYDTIPTDEERSRRANAMFSMVEPDQLVESNDACAPQATPHRQAQQSTSSVVQKQSVLRNYSNTDKDNSHQHDNSNDTAVSGVVNRSYSHTGSIQALSGPSLKQSDNELLEPKSKVQRQTEESKKIPNGCENKNEEGEQNKKPPPKTLEPIPNVSTAYAYISCLVDPVKGGELVRILKRKQARFRWFLAYTIINNYHLFDLRKNAENRLALLHITRSNATVESNRPNQASTDNNSQPAPPQLRSVVSPISPVGARARVMPGTDPLSPNLVCCPQCPAERYIAVRSYMMYDLNNPKIDSFLMPNPGRVLSSVNPQSPDACQSQHRAANLHLTPNTAMQSSPNRSAEQRSQRPSYHRQESYNSAQQAAQDIPNGTPNFGSVLDSELNTGNASLGDAVTIDSSAMRTQMSHAQHMQVWRQNQARKVQKKHPYRYVYGAIPKNTLMEKISTATVLTPQPVATGGNFQRQPSRSPFTFPPPKPTQGSGHDGAKNKNAQSSMNSSSDKKCCERDKPTSNLSKRRITEIQNEDTSGNDGNETKV